MGERISDFVSLVFVDISEVDISDFRSGKQGGRDFTEFSKILVILGYVATVGSKVQV